MSLDIAIDAALKRGASPIQVSRLLGVSTASVQKRADALKARVERMLHARRIQQIERECGFNQPASAKPELAQRDADSAAMSAWLALPIIYDNAPEPRWNAGAAARNDAILARRREVTRTMGGVADYSSREAA